MHRLPDLATKQDIAALRQEMSALESRLIAEVHRVERRALGAIAAMLRLVLAVVKLT